VTQLCFFRLKETANASPLAIIHSIVGSRDAYVSAHEEREDSFVDPPHDPLGGWVWHSRTTPAFRPVPCRIVPLLLHLGSVKPLEAARERCRGLCV
jgi:hypothetical protein